MANLGFLDTEGNIFHLDDVVTPTKKKKKDEEVYAMATMPLSVQPTVTVTPQSNLENAEKEFKEASDIYQKRLAQEIKKTGKDYKTTFDNRANQKISYQTKKEDIKPQPDIIPIVEAKQNLQQELENKQRAYDQWKIANYENNLARVKNEESTLFDKTLGVPIRATKDLLSPLTIGEDITLKDEKGNKTFLPSYNELKQQQVRKDTSGIGGLAQDIAYNATKVLEAGALDAVTGGIGGKALYWTDMSADNYMNAKNQGATNKQAIANTIVSTGSEFLTEKLLGGLSKQLTGGKASEIQNIVSNAVNKLVKNPKVSNIIGSMGSEALEEWVQEWVGALNNKITLGEELDVEQTLKDSLYSAAVGAGSGGTITGINNVEGRIAANNSNVLNERINTLKDMQHMTTNENTKTKIDESINKANEYISKPFGKDVESVMNESDNDMQEIAKLLRLEEKKSQQATQQATQQETPQTAPKEQNNINIQEETKTEPTTQETVQKEQVEEKTSRRVGNRDYSSSKFNNLSDEDIRELDRIYEGYKQTGKISEEDNAKLDILSKKANYIKNPEINTNINEFKDVSKDYTKYGKKADLENFDTTMTQKAKETIEGNKQGRRTKEQWLDVAKNIGMQAENLDSEALKKYAFASFMYEKPNQKQNLNRQGQKYVSFGVQDWVKAVYEGAGVGKQLEKPVKTEVKQPVKTETKENIPEEKVKEQVIKAIPKETKQTNYSENVQDAIKNKYVSKTQVEKITNQIRDKYKSLSEEQLNKIIDLKVEQLKNDNIYSKYSDQEKANKRKMINAYETNAEIRKVVQGDSLEKVEGGLTPKELEKANKHEQSNYIGKKVIADGMDAKVVGNVYGKVKVEFEDGTTKLFDKDDIEPIKKEVKISYPEVKQEKVITAKNNQGQTIKLKQDSKNNNVYNEEAINRDLKDLNTQFKNKTIKSKNGMEVSNFYSNITEKSKFIDPDIRNMFKTEDDIKFYKKVSNEEAMNEASKILGKTAKQQEKAFDDFISKKDQFNAVDGAQGWQLLQRFNDAGDYDRAYLVARKMREMGTSGGQYIQSLAIQSRLTPEGMYKWAVGELMDAEQKFNSEKGRTKKEIEKYRDSFKLTPEETEFIKTQMEKIQGMEDGRPKDIELAKINSMLQNKLPTKKGQSLKTWMRISMLFNPKTQVRNVVGNLAITPINAVSDIFSGAVDKAISKKTNVRTIGAPSLGGITSYGKGVVKGIKEATQDYRMGIDTKNVNQDRFDVGQGKPFNEKQTGPLKGLRNTIAKGLNATNDLLGYVMDVGDRAFYQGSVENSLYNQQKLNNSKEITNEMREIAENEGLQRTWNDNNEYTKAVLDLRRSINKIGNQLHLKVGEYGLGDLLIPFAKTPANLTKAIVDYSPVGFVNAITEGKNLKNAIETNNYTPQMQHDFSQTIGKAVAGTMLYVLGASLAKANITSGNSDEDKDLKNFMRNNLGIQPYSIKIGDKSFTYDWAQPVAAPLAITADIEKGMQENMTPEQAIQHFLTTGFNILSEQSFMSGINEVLNNNDGLLQGIEQQIVNIPATAIPTFLKQITDMTDGTKRQTYSKEGQTEVMKKTAKTKIPTESKKLAPQVDVLGNEIQKYGGDNNAFNVFFNPANMEKGKKTPVAEEIYSLYEATQDKTIIPRKVDYSTKINGENKILTTDEMAAWQKASGKLVTQEVERAMNSFEYQNMNDEQKAKVINKIVNYSYQKAKSNTFDTPLANTYNGVEKAQSKGIPIADYYISTVLKSSK